MLLFLGLFLLSSSCKQEASAEDSFDQLVKKAEEGSMASQFVLAEMYRKGEDVDQDLPKAAKWYGAAAEKGHPGALLQIGEMYLNGHGLIQSDKKGFESLLKAAMAGKKEPYYFLGIAYREGLVTEPNDIEACSWMKLALDAGDPRAARPYKLLKERMTPYQGQTVITRTSALRKEIAE